MAPERSSDLKIVTESVASTGWVVSGESAGGEEGFMGRWVMEVRGAEGAAGYQWVGAGRETRWSVRSGR